MPCDATEPTGQQATEWMQRGLRLLKQNTPTALTEAIDCFDRAIELRRQLAAGGDPLLCYGLAAGWMNRADALARLGTYDSLAQSVRSYDLALESLRTLPLDENPLFRRRLAIAWQNRGLTLQAQNCAPSMAEAKKSFAASLTALREGNASAIDDHDYLCAAVSVNYANILVAAPGEPGSAALARTEMRQTLAAIASQETELPSMAEIGFKARHVLCQSIAELLTEADSDAETNELLTEATDAVDSGMMLARRWEEKGAKEFRPLARELFGYGARVYQIHLPHFLNEFLLENLDPARCPGALVDDAQMHATALASLWRSFREIQRHGFQKIHTAEFEGFLQELQALRLAEDRLTQLRQRYSTAPS